MAPLAPLPATAALAAPRPVQAQAADPQAAQRAKAMKTAQDFEAMFLEQTLERIAAGGEDGPLGESGTGGVYRSMLVKEYAGQIAKSGGVGIATQVYREILRMQEVSHAARS